MAIVRMRALLAALGLCLALVAPVADAQQAAPGSGARVVASPSKRQLEDWRRAMVVIPRHRGGCFVSTYPQTQWTEAHCVAAPKGPLRPRKGGARVAQTVGDGTDYSAVTSSDATLAEGSFDSVTGVTSESGAGTANAYTLQLNTQFLTTTTCSGGASGCLGWEQFVYYNDPTSTSGGFIQYWMLGYGSPCPSGWTAYGSDCYTNSTYMSVVPAQSITTLGQMTLTGTAPSGSASDSVTVSIGSSLYALSGQSYFPDLAQHWNTSEFNIFGPGNGSQAAFNSGSTLTVRAAMNSGASSAPSCAAEGFTAETNNLSLVTTPASADGGSLPAIVFIESNASGATTATCAAASDGVTLGFIGGVASLSTARSNQTATLLPNGNVLVEGGYNGAALASAELYNPSTHSWSSGGTMASARSLHTAALLANGRVLVAGGNGASSTAISSAELYNPATNTWSSAGSMALARLAHTVTVLANGMVLIAGGSSGSSAIATAELYNPATNSWSSAGTMAHAHYYHSATLLPGGLVLIAGGYTSGGSVSGTAELYNPATNSWSSAGTMVNARVMHSATLLPGGSVLVAGGGTSTSILASAELYNPASNSWSALAPMANAREEHTATLLTSGQVLAAGGDGTVGIIGSAELYDPETNIWTSAGTLATARGDHAAILEPTGMVLLVGGLGGAGNYLASAELYSPGASTWDAGGAMLNARAGATGTLLPSGAVLEAGGSNGSSTLSAAEIYNATLNSWSATSSMQSARQSHSATLLTGGLVLVAGGQSGATALASAEIYRAGNGTWSSAGAMANARYGHSATLLANGLVLVAGGNSGSGVTASAELFNPASNSWSSAGSMLNARANHTATLLSNGLVLVAGGSGSSSTLAAAEIYNPNSNTWAATASMANARANHSATLLPSGIVLVAGGQQGSSTTLASAELYNPATGTWSAAGSLARARSNHDATVLLNGLVLVAGGQASSTRIATAELYNPALNTWSAAGSMTNARTAATATLLPGGSVLVAGGQSVSADLSAAELYSAGLSFQSAWQPALTQVPASVTIDNELALTGTQFLGVSEASGGNTYQNSATNYPVAMLQRIDNGQQWWLGMDETTSYSSTSLTTGAVSGLAAGPALLTVFVNGIPNAGPASGMLDTQVNEAPISATATSITRGQSDTLTVTPGGSGPFTYQWYVGISGNASNPIAGATGSSIVVQPGSTTNYWVLVTGPGGVQDSQTITISVGEDDSPPTDGPMPLWALIVLGMGLLLIGQSRRFRRI